MAMQNTRTVGVIIPVYNGEKWLKETIDSVFTQPCKNLIAVVVNDGSTDRSEDIVKKASKSFPNLFYIKQDNKGVSAARNAGIDFLLNSWGVQYLSFLDADDIWVPGFYTDELESNIRSENKDVFQFSHYWSNNTMTRLKKHPANTFDESSQELNRYDRGFASYFYNARLFRDYKIRFPEGMKVQEDVVFKYVILTAAKTYRSSDKYMFIYRSNADSVLHKKITKKDENNFLNSVIPCWDWAEQELTRLRLVDKDSITEEDIQQCKVMKKTYAVDAITNLCGLGFSLPEIRKTISDYQLIDMIENDLYLDNKRKQTMDLFRKNPRRVMMTFRVRALGLRFARLLRNNPLSQHRRYPLLAEDVLWKESV